MSKQRPDPDKIANELAGASAFFRRPNPDQGAASSTPPAPTTSVASQASPIQERTADSGRTPVRPVRPTKRQMIRHPFELYMDQLDRLRAAAQTEREHGGAGSMSKMVRDAIDQLLDQLPPTAG